MKVYSCPACGGAMEWDGASGGLKCRNCGTALSVREAAPAGYHRYQALPSFMSLQPYQCLPVRCPVCGAETKTDGRTVSLICQYCGAGLVLDGKQLAFARPDGTARLMIPGDRVRLLIKEWCGRHPFAPDLTSKHLEVKFISPQYIPFWVFSARVTAKYTGRGGRNMTVTEKNARGIAVTRTAVDWHPISGTASADLEGFCVPADQDIAGDYASFLWRSTPADAFSAWQSEYFAGSFSFLPTVPVNEAEAMAHERMVPEIKRRTVAELSRSWSHIDFREFSVSYSGRGWRLVQIPAYFVICRYHGGIYVDAVNGVTGEIFGTYPISLRKVTIFYATAAAVLIPGYLFFDYGSCGMRGCLTDSGSIFADALIALCVATGAYALIYIALRLRILGKDDLRSSPWLREIADRTR